MRILDNLSQKQTFAVASELNLKPGDAVQIAIAENQLLRAALIMYLWPLFALFAGAACAESWLPANFASDELVVSGFAGLSFLLSLRLIKLLQQRFLHSQHCQPVITEKL